MSAARIAGQLDLTGAQLHGHNQDGNSLVADGVQVGGGMFLSVGDGRPFTAAGAVRLTGARITGQFGMSGAQLRGDNQDGNSLVADGVQVGGGMFLSVGDGRPFTAAGAVRLTGARITGQLGTSGAQIQGHDKNGDSFIADRVHVDGDALLRVRDGRPFTAVGAVRLTGARITGQLGMSGAQIQGHDKNGNSLVANRAQIDSDAFLRVRHGRPFTAVGAVRLIGARITGQLGMSEPKYRATTTMATAWSQTARRSGACR